MTDNTSETLGIECLGTGTFVNGKDYYVLCAKGKIVRFKVGDCKPQKLLTLAPLDKWRECFPDMARRPRGGEVPISWLRALDWLFSSCHQKGPYTVPEREIEIGQRRDMEIGEYIKIPRGMWQHERDIFECMKEGMAKHSRDLAPKFDYQIGENEVIVKRIG